MPYTVEGIGTWYYGKSNVHVQREECGACHRVGDLKSYDTTKFFVFFHIPILPLGRKRVLQQCPSCHRHRAIRLKDWERDKAAALSSSFEACRAAPDDPQKAKEAIGATIFFQDADALDAALAVLGPRARADADVLCLIGGAQSQFGRLPEAEDALKASLAIKPDPEVSEILAVNLLQRRRADEAWSHLQHILDEKLAEKAPLLLLVAESYQSWGMHDEALTVLDEVAAVFPDLAQAKNFRKILRVSEKHRGTGKEIRAKNIESLGSKPVQERKWLAKLPRLVPPVVLVVAATFYLVAAFAEARSRRIQVVNGLDRPYQVTVNGIEQTIPPKGWVSAKLPEGEVAIKVLTPELGIADQTCQVTTPFFTRPFKDYTIVVNPDQTALLMWEEAYYSQSGTLGPSGGQHYKLRVGSLLTEFKDVDYPFEPFPQSISMSDTTKYVKKDRVSVLSDLPFASAVRVVSEECGEEAARDFVRRQAQYHPDDAIRLGYMQTFCEPQDRLAVLTPLLQRRPVLIEAHRSYQTDMERVQPERDLRAEYQALLDADPGNPDLAYLAGRIAEDPQEAEAFFVRATRTERPCAYAYHALAYQRMSAGRFEEAVELAGKATALRPDNEQFWWIRLQALCASERYDDMIGLIHEKKRPDELDVSLLAEELYALTCDGKGEQADAVLRKLVDSADDDSREARERIRDLLSSTLLYVKGDLAAWKASLADPANEDEGIPWAQAVMEGDVEAARAILKKENWQTSVNLLTVYVTAQAAGEMETATTVLEEAVPTLREESREMRRVAEWLASDGPLSVDEVLTIELLPHDKALVLTVMGLRFPALKPGCFELARRLNYDRRFPHLLLKKILDEGATTKPEA